MTALISDSPAVLRQLGPTANIIIFLKYPLANKIDRAGVQNPYVANGELYIAYDHKIEEAYQQISRHSQQDSKTIYVARMNRDLIYFRGQKINKATMVALLTPKVREAHAIHRKDNPIVATYWENGKWITNDLIAGAGRYPEFQLLELLQTTIRTQSRNRPERLYKITNEANKKTAYYYMGEGLTPQQARSVLAALNTDENALSQRPVTSPELIRVLKTMQNQLHQVANGQQLMNFIQDWKIQLSTLSQKRRNSHQAMVGHALLTILNKMDTPAAAASGVGGLKQSLQKLLAGKMP